MKRILLSYLTFCLYGITVAQNITAVEYFFGADPGAGSGTAVSITAAHVINRSFDISIASLTDGFHTLSVRAKDADNKWSTTFTTPFYKISATTLTPPNLTKLEYFIDVDPGAGSGVAITFTSGTIITGLTFNVPLSSVSAGQHTISVRAMDANGKWSIVNTSAFGVSGTAPVAQPTGLTFTNITSGSYNVTYVAPASAPAGYVVVRKAGSAPTSDPVDGSSYIKGDILGDGVIAYEGTAVTFNETALISATQYFYKIYAYNASGLLTNYLTTAPLAGNLATIASPVQINTETFPTSFKKGSTLTASITVNDAVLVSAVNFKSRGISEAPSALKSIALTAVGNKFEKIVASADLTDPIGLIYSFEVIDKTQGVLNSTSGKSYVKYDQTIPSLSFGNQVSNYQIIAVPMKLTNETITKAFASLMPYDKAKWRLFDYANNNNREYNAFNTIEPGKGYWLIVKNSQAINPGEGTAVHADNTTPFEIRLSAGWNLIGNPYNFRVSWTDVLAANENPAAVDSKLKVFAGGALTDGTILEPYRGAFVFSNSAVTLKIPVTRNTTLGRVSEETDIVESLDQNHWEVRLTLNNGLVRNELGGIGMHPLATLKGKDKFDGVSVPLPEGLGLFELAYPHPEVFADFNKEVVPTQENFTWDFDVTRSSYTDDLELTWVNNYFGENEKQLMIFDPATLQVVDMRLTNHFSISESTKKLSVLFGGNDYIQRALDNELPWLGNAYPNPATEELTIPFRIPQNIDLMPVQIKIFNALGTEVATPIDQTLGKGSYEIKWQPEGRTGLYIVRMTIGKAETKPMKVIIK